jgi:hypothetical protein
MTHKTYNSLYYWQRVMEKSEYTFEKVFNDDKLTPESLICHFVITNCYGPSGANTWIAFPNVDAVIGFLRHVFIPTAFIEWFSHERSMGVLSIERTWEEWLDLYRDSEKCKYKGEIPIIKENIKKLDEIWNLTDQEEMVNALVTFAVEFEEIWTKDNAVFFYFQLFKSPTEVGNYIIDAYKEENLLERIHDQLGVTVEEWRDITEQVYESLFMKKRFIDILNNNIKDIL